MRRTSLAMSAGTAVLSCCALVACTQAPDFSAVKAERTKAVVRSDLFQSVVSNGKVIVAGTAGGALVRSTDDGRNWTRHTLESPSSIVALAACPDGSFAALDFYRKVWTAAADGATWSAHPITTSDNVLALACDPGNALWVVGSRSRILVSTDKGGTWQSRHSGDDSILTTVQFVDRQRAHVLGEFGTHLATTDGGATWVKQPALPGDFYPYAAVFKDTGQGWASGLAGVLLHTNDAGRSWVKQANPADAPLYAAAAVGQVVYAAGAGGQVLGASAGDSWARVEHGKVVPAFVAAAAAHGPDMLVMAGAAGVLHVFKPPVVAGGRAQ